MAISTTSNVIFEFSGQKPNHDAAVANSTAHKAKRTKSPGVRVVGNRIYDSTHGITCHQCRQKTRDFAASCKNLKDGKQCVIRFCHKCLKNRYGEVAEQVELLDDWNCPKCRNICNCSCCMKRRGEKPTGNLVHTAKAEGFESVSEMLRVKAAQKMEKGEVDDVVSPMKESALEKDARNTAVNSSCSKVQTNNFVSHELVVVISGETGKENSLDGSLVLKHDSLKAEKASPVKTRKTKREELKEISNGKSIDASSQNRRSLRHKICNEAPEEETKRNAYHGDRAAKEVSTKEAKINMNQGIVHVEGHMIGASKDSSFNSNKKDLKENMSEKNSKGTFVKADDVNAAVKSQIATTVFHGVSEKEMKVDKSDRIIPRPMDGPKASGANDIFLHPSMWAPGDAFSNPSQSGAKEDMSRKILKGTVVPVYDDTPFFKSEEGIAKAPKVRACTVNSLNRAIEQNRVEIPLPTGTVLTNILDVEFQPEDAGNALQFLEFCRTFGKVLDVKKGEAEAILRELVRKRNLRRGQNTLAVQFQIRVLTLILIDSGIESPSLTTGSGEKSWLKALEDLIAESELVLKGFPLDWLKQGIVGYHDLDLSKKLSLLNFLCDEALCTEKLRSYIDEQNSSFAGEKKEAKSKVAAAKEKERSLKQKLQDEMAKAIISNGPPLSIAEHDALLSKIKKEAAQAHAEVLEVMGTIPKGKQSADAMRTEPVFSDGNGHAFWKLKSYDGESAVLMQEIKMEDATAATAEERWFVHGPEMKDEIDKYISSRATKRPYIHKVTPILSNESNEANMNNV